MSQCEQNLQIRVKQLQELGARVDVQKFPDDVLVAFDCPDEVANHPDVRVEKHNNGIVKMAYLCGCKTCQRTLSKCKCAAADRIPSDALVYDESFGLVWSVFSKFFDPDERFGRKPKPKITKEIIQPLLPDSEDYVDEAGDESTPQQRFHMPEQIEPRLIQFWESKLRESGNKPVFVYLSYPAKDEGALKEFWTGQGKEFPTDARPIDEGSRGGTTERRASSVFMTFIAPPDESILRQLKWTKKKFDWGESSNIRFGLKLYFEFPHLCDFKCPGFVAGASSAS